MSVYSIGHYNHSKDEFLEMLRAKEIDFVADVRTIPGSNRSPHFNKDQLKEWLEEASITYSHFPKLGGRRKMSTEVGEVLNEGWENQSFHNYADYTLTESFKEGIDELKFHIKDHRVVLMCAERHPSRCHRLIISNYLQANGYNVTHLLPSREGKVKSVEHELGEWGATPLIEKDRTVVYPKF
ncbi:DUF488 family protein [Saliterribacillus persicus]|uniref:Uncharacterized protein DUF488 n=1 Tax=Saliterribacillus persicus TaxID=930114 RepID=A0A368Y9R1_9BACI|nr:DUF488 domain-containing protein [Saliterribacillus persicus]RCW77010.1 uncharacterized protein DUF488 [Saliterribacillus persicus]